MCLYHQILRITHRPSLRPPSRESIPFSVRDSISRLIVRSVTKDVTKELTERQQIILEFMQADGTITISEMSQKTNVTERKHTEYGNVYLVVRR